MKCSKCGRFFNTSAVSNPFCSKGGYHVAEGEYVDSSEDTITPILVAETILEDTPSSDNTTSDFSTGGGDS